MAWSPYGKQRRGTQAERGSLMNELAFGTEIERGIGVCMLGGRLAIDMLAAAVFS